jgi:hypothetical protein
LLQRGAILNAPVLLLATTATTVVFVRITASARKRAISDVDIWHGLDNYMRVYEDQGEVAMFIGPARDGTVLEIGVVLDYDDPRIIHAMRARAKYWP